MHYVYLIQSVKTKKVYIGFTKNLEKRIKLHNAKETTSTKNEAPWELIYFEGFRNKTDAIIRENKLKNHGNSKRFVKDRIKNSLL